MKKTQRFFALILCVILLLPILGCGQNKPRESKPLPSQTVQESAPAPESSKPSGPVYDTEPPIMESEPENSEPPVTESEPFTENSEHIESSTPENLEGTIELPDTIDELLQVDFDRETLYNDIIFRVDATEGAFPNDILLDIRKNAIVGVDKDNMTSVKTVIYRAKNGINDYMHVTGRTFVFAEEDSIKKINTRGEISTIYKSPDGLEIRTVIIINKYLFFVEGDYFYVLNYSTSEKRCICWVGDVTNIYMSIDSVNIFYVERMYYNGELLYVTDRFCSIDENGNEVSNLGNAIHNGDVYCEYFEINISDGTIIPVSERTAEFGRWGY